MTVVSGMTENERWAIGIIFTVLGSLFGVTWYFGVLAWRNWENARNKEFSTIEKTLKSVEDKVDAIPEKYVTKELFHSELNAQTEQLNLSTEAQNNLIRQANENVRSMFKEIKADLRTKASRDGMLAAKESAREESTSSTPPPPPPRRPFPSRPR